VNTSERGQALAEAEASLVPRITLLVTTGCHFCDDAREELTTRALRGDVELTVVSAQSEEGRLLQASHRPSMFPLVLIDGEPFSVGRLPRRKLAHTLESLRGR
jgi:glutaredoxin